MLRAAIAGALLLAGTGASVVVAGAAPRNDDCVNCAPSQSDSTETPAKIRREIERLRALEAQVQSESVAVSERMNDAAARECADCPAPKHYDNVEVIKTSRDVDQSRVINTESVVEVPPRVEETNKLVIHENETRNVGVVHHNHRLIEKQIRYPKQAPVYRYAAPAYRAVPRVQTVLVPVVIQPSPPCGCSCSCSQPSYGYAQAYTHNGYAHGRAAVQQIAVQQVLVPVAVPSGYGYGYRYR